MICRGGSFVKEEEQRYLQVDEIIDIYALKQNIG